MVFPRVEFREPDLELTPERIKCAQFTDEDLIKLLAEPGPEVVAEAHGRIVLLDRTLHRLQPQVGQVAAVLLAPAAEEVEVFAAVALAAHDDEPAAAAGAPHQTLEEVLVPPLPDTAAPQRQDPLHSVEDLGRGEWLVTAGVLHAVVLDSADVVLVAQDAVELVSGQRTARVTLRRPGMQSGRSDLHLYLSAAVLASGEQLEQLGDERRALGIEGDGADFPVPLPHRSPPRRSTWTPSTSSPTSTSGCTTPPTQPHC